MVGQRWVIALIVAVGVVLALAIAGLPTGGSGSSDLPVLTDNTTVSPTSFNPDGAVPTIPPRSGVPNIPLSTSTTFPR